VTAGLGGPIILTVEVAIILYYALLIIFVPEMGITHEDDFNCFKKDKLQPRG
jgi:hypothetical protein